MSHTRSISHAHDANESIGCFQASRAFAASAHREKVSAAAASRSAYLVGMERCVCAAPREAQHTQHRQVVGLRFKSTRHVVRTNYKTHRAVAS